MSSFPLAVCLSKEKEHLVSKVSQLLSGSSSSSAPVYLQQVTDTLEQLVLNKHTLDIDTHLTLRIGQTQNGASEHHIAMRNSPGRPQYTAV